MVTRLLLLNLSRRCINTNKEQDFFLKLFEHISWPLLSVLSKKKKSYHSCVIRVKEKITATKLSYKYHILSLFRAHVYEKGQFRIEAHQRRII